MPSYKDPSDGRWRYRFTYRGKRHGGSTPKGDNTKRAADALERELLRKLEARQFTGRMPTVAEFSGTFLDFQKANTKQLTYELHETVMRLHIVPHIGATLLDGVTAATLSHLMTAWLAAGAGRRTCNTRIGIAVRMLSLAVEWGVLPKVPKVKLLKIAQEHPRFLSDAESRKLIDAAATARSFEGKPQPWHTMIIVALRTGLRIGELRGLQWSDIDLEQGAIRVVRTDPGRRDLDANAPKGNRPRVVPLTDEAIAALRAWYEKLGQGELARSRRPNAFVFPGASKWHGEQGRVRSLAQGSCATAMARAVKRAGLDEGEVGWHTLRHTYASQLAMRGVPLRAIQELLGHATIKQTEAYAHLSPGYANRELVAALDIPMLAPGSGEAEPASSTVKALPPGPRRRARRRRKARRTR
jgi:integrase